MSAELQQASYWFLDPAPWFVRISFTMLVYRICAITVLSSVLGLGADVAMPAADIMRRVAENQDRLQQERNQFVYEQNIRVVSRQNNGKLICQQDTQYIVAPKEKSTEHKLVLTKGKCWQRGRYVEFQKDPDDKDETMDRGFVKSFRDDLTHSDSKDGIGKDLFPLTSKEQQELEFELAGERMVHERPAYVIRFRPRDHKEYGWAGEAVIDKEEFEPVTVYTQMSRKLPFFVRTMLGTDVPGLGFTTQYTRVAKGVWFPSSFGTEFKVHAVYFFHRTVTVSLENTKFRRTSVDAQIHFDPVQ